MPEYFPLTGKERIVDLSHPLNEGTPSYPGDPPLRIQPLATVAEDGYLLSTISSVFHSGTHVDVPGHFITGGALIDDLSLTTWYGHAVLIDAGVDPVLLPSLIEPIRMMPVDFILFRTGWDRHYGDPAYFLDHPTLSLELAVELSRLPIKGIGMDLPSPDRSPYPVHQFLLQRGIVILENLTCLDQLPACQAFPFMALPNRIKAEAAWVRPLAWIPVKE